MLNANDTLKVLLPAEKIPENSIVTKKTGEKSYSLKHSIKVYHSNMKDELNKVEVNVNGFFLIDGSGNINQVDKDCVLGWEVSLEELNEIYINAEYGDEY